MTRKVSFTSEMVVSHLHVLTLVIQVLFFIYLLIFEVTSVLKFWIPLPLIVIVIPNTLSFKVITYT